MISCTSGSRAYSYIAGGIGAADSARTTASVTVTIPQGSGASSIVDILDENGLVRSRAMAKIHARIGGYDTLQANTYIFSRSDDST